MSGSASSSKSTPIGSLASSTGCRESGVAIRSHRDRSRRDFFFPSPNPHEIGDGVTRESAHRGHDCRHLDLREMWG